MKKLIFGTGIVCQAFMRAYGLTANDVDGFVESDKHSNSFEGRPLYSVNELGGYSSMKYMWQVLDTIWFRNFLNRGLKKTK